MDKFLFVVTFCILLAFPVMAAGDLGGDLVDGIISDADTSSASVPSDPADNTPSQADPVEAAQVEEGISLLSDDAAFAGGYYFVCDCALGYDLMFYVPLEWAHDVFTLDVSGAPVNLSTNTCYAYCPSFPDYTFSCSRFGTFTYRSSNYTTSDLMITEIKDSNISFFDDSTVLLSDLDLNVLSCVLIFCIAGLLIIKKG